jgi:drug/metabolite transporter (DMT)-like permease
MQPRRYAFPLFLTGSAILSAGPLLVRLADVGAAQSAFWRVALAALPLMLLARLTAPGDRMPTGKASWWLAGAGLFFAADLASWHFGILKTTMANATLFGNMTSLFLPLWGYIAARSLPGRRDVAALTLAATGMVLLMGLSAQIGRQHLVGDLLSVAAGLFYTVYIVLMDRARGGLSAFGALAASTSVSALALLPFALLMPGSFWPGDWTPLVLLALGSQMIGQGLIIFALPHLPPLAAGLGLLIQPIFAVVIGWSWFGERVSLPEAAGMTAILAALLLARSARA